MDEDTVAALAQEVVAARRALHPLRAILPPAPLEDGYRVQTAANTILEEELGQRVGFKIGGTTQPMRDYILVPEPVTGAVFATSLYPDGATLRLGDYVRVGLETEIAVRLGRPMPPRADPYGRDDALAATQEIMAAIEIVDDRYADFRKAGAATIVAGNAFGAGLLLGRPRRDFAGLDLAGLRARTMRDGSEVASGSAVALLGHPMEAVAWLANQRSRAGDGLPSGTIITLGSITPVFWIDEPGRWRIEVESLGAVEVRFA